MACRLLMTGHSYLKQYKNLFNRFGNITSSAFAIKSLEFDVASRTGNTINIKFTFCIWLFAIGCITDS